MTEISEADKFVVIRKMNRKPFVHYSMEYAINEAERLTAKEGDKFYIYKIVATTTGGDLPHETGEDELDEVEATLRGSEFPLLMELPLKMVAIMRRQRAENQALKAQLQAERAWRPIADAPKDGRGLLLWNGYAREYVGFYGQNGWQTTYMGGPANHYPVPSYFKPLPPAPTKTGESDGN